MTHVRVVCDHHRSPHKIGLFVQLNGTWQAAGASSAAAKRRAADSAPADPANPMGALLSGPGKDREVKTVFIVGPDEQPVEPTKGYLAAITHEADGMRSVFDLTCQRCRRRRTHATFVRREEKLWPLLDALAEAGITTVTPEALSKIATRLDAAAAKDAGSV